VANELLIGKQLGAYLIQAKIGEGGMAQVYKGYHTRLRRDVAIKVIAPQIAVQAGFRERFEREAQLVANLNHPNIVTVYDFGEVGSITYLVMQYVGGGTLRDLLQRAGSLEPRQAVQYIIQIARALHHAHQHGIVHRDIKPQNMLIASNDANTALLSDFGIARLFSSSIGPDTIPAVDSGASASDGALTSAGQFLGTIDYMAPEQVRQQPVDARTDIYALGIVLFQLLTGRLPYSSTTSQGMLFQHAYGTPLSARELVPTIPAALEQIIYRALAKDPEQRYQTAEEMAAALEAVFAPPMIASNYHPASDDTPTFFSQHQAIPSHYDHWQRRHQPTPTASAYPATAANQSGYASIIPQPPARRAFPISAVLGTAAVVIIAAILLISRVLPPLSHPSSPDQASTGTATAFVEQFSNNNRNWTVGSPNNNLTAAISNNQYILTIGNAQTTYFPNPTSVGALPANFTLSAHIMQTRGATTAWYGIAFHLKENGSAVYTYAFVIDSEGDYEVLKYDPTVWSTPSKLWAASHFSAVHTGLNQTNLLQVTAQRSTFSFSINGAPAPVTTQDGYQPSNVQGTPSTITDTSYTGGNLGLLVTGPDTQFMVTTVTLKIP
jgi:serine/threonine protein kinase